jgi:hypothetical protein
MNRIYFDVHSYPKFLKYASPLEFVSYVDVLIAAGYKSAIHSIRESPNNWGLNDHDMTMFLLKWS